MPKDRPINIVLWRGPSDHEWKAKVFTCENGFLAAQYAREMAQSEWTEVVLMYRAEFPEWFKTPIA